MPATIEDTPNTGVAILSRVFEDDDAVLTADSARLLAALRFRKSDERRMIQLAAKARKGTL